MSDLDDRIGDIADHLEREGKLGPRFKGPTPKTQRRYGTHGSLSIEVSGPDRGSWYDHEEELGGGPYNLIWKYGYPRGEACDNWLRDKLGIRREPRNKNQPPRNKRQREAEHPGSSRIEATYDYVDEKGALLFQVVRFAGHKFLQRRPDGKGWIWKLGDTRKVLYRLPELIAAKATGNGHPWRVYLCEGEKDADRLRDQWGVVATTNPGGAGNWDASFDACFAGAEVILLEDNDKAGRARSTKLAPRLARAAVAVRVVSFPNLEEGGDISDWLDAGGSQSDLETVIEQIEPYDPNRDGNNRKSQAQEELDGLVPPGQPDVKSAGIDYGPIAPRQWLLGTNFCRGFLSGLTGAGGTGKTAIRLLQFIALALGRGDLTGEHVFKRTKVLIVCLEDDEAELRRRIRAACLHHKLVESDLDGWLYYWTPHDLRLLEVDRYGQAEPGELGDALRRIIKQLDIGLVGVDPFVKSHSASENDNNLIDQVATLFLQVAHDCGCACDYVHHHKKGVTIAGDPDSARGAGSLVNASRLVKTATKMTEAEAEDLAVEDTERRQLVRMDDAKLNIAPPAELTVWFKLVGVDIDNGAGDYPNGDNVQTVERWCPANLFEDFPKSKIAAIFDQLRAGPGDGEFYSPFTNANERWAGWQIVQLGDKTRAEAKHILKAWIRTGVLIEEEYLSPKGRKDKWRVVVNETKAREILGALYQPPDKDKAPPPAEVQKNVSGGGDRHDVLDRIFTAIDRGVPPNGDDGVRYYRAEATAEHAAWRVVVAHRPELNSAEAQAMVKEWVKIGVFIPGDDGLRLSPLTKQLRGIGE